MAMETLTTSATTKHLIDITKCRPSERDEQQIRQLIPWFKGKYKFSEKLHEDILFDIIRNSQYRQLPINTVIIRQGEKGDCFYILLSGNVSVYILGTNEIEQMADHLQKSNEGLDRRKDPNDITIAPNKDKYGNCVAVLKQYQGFGELALISKDCARNASIIAEDPVELLIVTRELYNRSLRIPQEKEFEQKVEFVQTFPYFSNWMYRHKKQLAMSLATVIYPIACIFTRQGESLGGLQFLMKGEAKLVVDQHAHISQFPEFRDELGMNEDLTDRPSTRARRRSATFHHKQELCLIGPHEVIGELECAVNLNKNCQSSVCTTDICEVYVLNMKNFERLVVKKYPKTLDLMKQHAELQLRNRIGRYPPHHIPLFTLLAKQLEPRPLSEPLLTALELTQNDNKLSKKEVLTKLFGLPDTPGEMDRKPNFMQPRFMRSGDYDMPNERSDEEDFLEEETQAKYLEEDYETSDSALSSLETRMQTWIKASDTFNYGENVPSRLKNSKNVFALRRFNYEGADKLPIPGAKVVIRPKPIEEKQYRNVCEDMLDTRSEDSDEYRISAIGVSMSAFKKYVQSEGNKTRTEVS